MAESARPRRTTSRRSASPTDSDPRSTGTLTKDVVTGIQTIVRKEIELAQHELKAAARGAGQAAGLGGAAAVMALFVVGFLGAAGARALEEVLRPWAAWLIVAGVFLLLSLVMALIARSRVNRAPLPPSQTQQSIKENVEWVRTQLRR